MLVSEPLFDCSDFLSDRMRYHEPVHIRVIRRWYKPLIETIKVEDVLPYLVSEEFVTVRELGLIKSKISNYGRTDASEHLVMNVSDNWWFSQMSYFILYIISM